MRFKIIVSIAVGTCFVLILAMMNGAVKSQVRAPQSAAGTVNSGINYQGFLNDSSGNPLVGSHLFRFELYNAPSGGDKL